MAMFPFLAAVASGWFCFDLLRRFIRDRRPQHLAWALALSAFCAASLSAAAGMSLGWSAGWFRSYYYFGAVVNVPVLAVGTLYLYLSRPMGHVCALVVAGLAAYAALVVMTAEVNHPGLTAVVNSIPMGSDVISDRARSLSRYYSYAGFAIVVGGAIWSARRLARRPGEAAKRLMQGNVLIALGTSVVAVASVFARQGQGSVFAVGLALGAAVMYAGFLRASTRRAYRPAGKGTSGSGDVA
ncbi:MAG: hypothetical protein KY393_06560 [Actinobacteria bacterium]|nr:hypothetical protein [Actinomycetota bacterium]